MKSTKTQKTNKQPYFSLTKVMRSFYGPTKGDSRIEESVYWKAWQLVTAIKMSRTAMIRLDQDMDVYYNGADFGHALDELVLKLEADIAAGKVIPETKGPGKPKEETP